MLNMYKQIWLAVLLPVFVIHPASADDTVVDKFRIAIGGYKITRYDSSISLTDKGVGLGVSFVPEDTLGWDTKQSVFRIDGHYRFTDSHALTYSWYRINSDGNKVLTKDIEWVDENGNTITIPTGATVRSNINYDIYKIGYLWSFYNNDKVELAAGAGVHVTRIAVGLTADTTSSGQEAKDVKTTVPLPVLSFSMNYHITPRFGWNMKTEFFSLSFDDWDGVYTDSQLGMEYRLTDHTGVGVGIGSNSLKIIQDTSDYKFGYENRVTGILVYLAGYF